jgi:streptogramin lyase
LCKAIGVILMRRVRRPIVISLLLVVAMALASFLPANAVASSPVPGPEVSMTGYDLADAQSNPQGITSGPDGALWFTEAYGNKIGRITTSGTISEYAVPTSGSSPFGITAGPDGNLWFTEYDGNKIGRITTSGTITEYAVPTSSSYPEGIAAGPDGNLWFTEGVSSKIGKVTPSGSFTEYAVPTSGSSPFGITAGPDGASGSRSPMALESAASRLLERLPSTARGPRRTGVGEPRESRPARTAPSGSRSTPATLPR